MRDGVTHIGSVIATALYVQDQQRSIEFYQDDELVRPRAARLKRLTAPACP
jgi:hypothetical protein